MCCRCYFVVVAAAAVAVVAAIVVIVFLSFLNLCKALPSRGNQKST